MKPQSVGNFMTLGNLCTVVTQAETWVHHFDPEAKKQSMQQKHPASPSPKKFESFSCREGDGLYLLG